MILTYILFVLGLVFLIKGADLLVEGAASIAKKFGISTLVIGLTIVSFGTSAPELVVNLLAGFRGTADLAIGNVIGSNIANILLILGISALIYPLKVTKGTTWKEIPLSLLAVFALFVMANDALIDKLNFSAVSRIDGIIFMFFFIIFIYYTFGISKAKGENNVKVKKLKMPIAILYIILGITGLTFGGQWVVDGAVAIARQFGLSESLVGLTIVAIGTSLPELATSAVAAFKRQADIAVGNIVGSNIFNILWILGLSATVKGMPYNPFNNFDIFICIAATAMLFFDMFIGKRHLLQRWQGGVMVGSYILYITFLVFRG